MVFENETYDELGIGGLGVIQEKNGFRFGCDAVLLSNFVRIEKGARVLDMCTGSGIVAFLVYAKHDPSRIDALEIDPSDAERAKRSAMVNSLSDKIVVREGDIKNAAEIYGKAVFDAVTCNPPYMQYGGGLLNPNGKKAIARHEILCDINDVARAAAGVLKVGGKLFLVHRANRLCDIICALRENKIEPKRIALVAPKADSVPNLVLIEAVRGGGANLTFEKMIYLYDEDGNYTATTRGD